MNKRQLSDLDLSKDQHIFSIRKDGVCMGHIEITDGKITTTGDIGEGNIYNNFPELMWYLSEFDISFNNLFR